HEMPQPTQTASLKRLLTSPTRLFARSEVLQRPSLVPPTNGCYAWYFREVPKIVPTRGCLTFRRARTIRCISAWRGSRTWTICARSASLCRWMQCRPSPLWAAFLAFDPVPAQSKNPALGAKYPARAPLWLLQAVPQRTPACYQSDPFSPPDPLG